MEWSNVTFEITAVNEGVVLELNPFLVQTITAVYIETKTHFVRITFRN